MWRSYTRGSSDQSQRVSSNRSAFLRWSHCRSRRWPHSFSFTAAPWLIGGLGLYFLIRSLGTTTDITTTIPFLGGIAAIGAIVAVLAIFAPSGLGAREASMYALLIAVTSDPTALGATILNRLTITIVELGLFLAGVAIWKPDSDPRLRLQHRIEQLKPEGTTF